MKLLNIITPCTRPENLRLIEQSINIPESNYRWIIILDKPEISKEYYVPKKCEFYNYQERDSVYGNAQRNFALKIIDCGHIYFNDDDTIIHKNLWSNIENLLPTYDFISFDQEEKDGSKRLFGSNIKLHYIDSHNFIVKHELVGNQIFDINKYFSDGIFAINCYKLAKKPIYIKKILSTYNALKNK